MTQSSTIHLENLATSPLKFVSEKLTARGYWEINPAQTAKLVKTGQTAVFKARSSGPTTLKSPGKLLGDAEGSVLFADKFNQVIKISFDVPFFQGSTGNTYLVEADNGYEWEVYETDGDNESSVRVVIRDSKEVRTAFLPSVHGLRYPNRHDNNHVPVFEVDLPAIGKVKFSDITNGVCGGMCAVVLDAFFAGQRSSSREARIVNDVTYGPWDGNDPLMQNVIKRLLDSFTVDNIRKFITYSNEAYPLTNSGVTGWLAEVGQQGLSYKICTAEWPFIKAQLRAGRPVVLGLCYERTLNPMGAAKAHQVIAWRYKQAGNEVSIGIYDPNHDVEKGYFVDTAELRFTLKSPRTPINVEEVFLEDPGDILSKTSSKKVWAFFDTHYQPVRPQTHFSCLTQPGGALVARRPDHLDAFYFANQAGSCLPKQFDAVHICSAWLNESQGNQLYIWTEFSIAQRNAKMRRGLQQSRRARSLVAQARYTEHLDVFWSGQDGSINSAWWSAHTARWQHFQLCPAGSAKVDAELASVSRVPEHIDIFWISPAGQIMSTYFREQWHAPFALSEPDATVGHGLSVCANGSEHLCVIWTSQRGVQIKEWTHQGGWGEVATLVLPMPPALNGGVCVRSRRPGHFDLFCICEDGSVWSSWRPAGQTHWANPFMIASAGQADISSSLVAHHRLPDHLDVFWISPQGGVASAWWSAFVNHAAWNPVFLLPGKVKADARGPLGVVSRTECNLTVMYLDLDGRRQLCEFGSHLNRKDVTWRSY